MHNVWKEHLGYIPNIVEMNMNWYAFTFQKSKNSKWELGKPWNINNSPLLLKPWSPLCYAITKRLDKNFVWVRLPALPFHIWTFEHFKSTENYICDFLDDDMPFEETKQTKLERILVNLNIREGLGEEVDLSWGSYTYNRRLNYENIPCRCRRCHQYGHLIKSCKLWVKTKGAVYNLDNGWLQKSTPNAPKSDGLWSQKEQECRTDTFLEAPILEFHDHFSGLAS